MNTADSFFVFCVIRDIADVVLTLFLNNILFRVSPTSTTHSSAVMADYILVAAW